MWIVQVYRYNVVVLIKCMVLVVIKRFRLVLKVEEWEGRITVHFGFKSHYSLQPLSLPSRYQQRGRGWQTVLQMHQFKLCNFARMNKCRPSLNCVFSSPTHIGCCWPIFQHFCQRSEAKQQQIVKRNKKYKTHFKWKKSNQILSLTHSRKTFFTQAEKNGEKSLHKNILLCLSTSPPVWSECFEALVLCSLTNIQKYAGSKCCFPTTPMAGVPQPFSMFSNALRCDYFTKLVF